jgi:5'-AMP-activated protein kinase catalytic alpha subunit
MHVLTKEKLAVKILEKARIKKTEDLIRVKREIHILSKLHHPNLIQLYEVIETKCYYFLIMEYARHGELSKYIRKMVR